MRFTGLAVTSQKIVYDGTLRNEENVEVNLKYRKDC